MTFFEWCGYDTKLTEGEAIHAEAAWDHQQKIIDDLRLELSLLEVELQYYRELEDNSV